MCEAFCMVSGVCVCNVSMSFNFFWGGAHREVLYVEGVIVLAWLLHPDMV